MNKLVKDYYKIVYCMINKIINEERVNNILFQCKYNIYYQKDKKLVLDDNKKYPLINFFSTMN